MTRRLDFAAALAAASLAVAAPAAAETSFVLGQYSGPNQPLNARGMIPFLDALQERSGGEIQTSFAGGGAVVTAKTTLHALKDGLVDAAFVPTVYYPAELPVGNIMVNLGAMLSNVPAAIGAMNEVMLLDCPECDAEAAQWNMRYIGSWSLTPYDLICTKPVRTAADVQGLRIRSAGHTVPLATALGASPINVPSSEVYEVMERGQVDCAFSPPNWLDANSLGEVAKFVTDVNAGAVPNPHFLMMREDLWQDLTADQQALIMELSPMASAGGYFGTLETDETALAAEGIETIAPDETLVAAMEAAAKEALPTAVASAKEKGVENAQEIAERFLAAYEKWKGLVEGVDSEEAYAELLRKEIFAKWQPQG